MLWNSLPYQVNSLNQFEMFKSRLTVFLLTEPDKPLVKGYASTNSHSLLAWHVDIDAAALCADAQLNYK